MHLDRDGDEDGEKALKELSQLLCNRLLRDSGALDTGLHLEFPFGAEEFQEKLASALRESIAEMRREGLMAILIAKARAERQQSGEPVLTENELPPGFSSN